MLKLPLPVLGGCYQLCQSRRMTGRQRTLQQHGERPRPPNFSPSCAWLQASLVTLMAEHITKHCLTFSSNDLRASVARLGGVTLAMWTILQKLPHMRNKETVTWRLTAATSTRPESSFINSAHLPAINLENSVDNPQLEHLGCPD